MLCLQGEQATWDNVLTWLSSTTSKSSSSGVCCGLAVSCGFPSSHPQPASAVAPALEHPCAAAAACNQANNGADLCCICWRCSYDYMCLHGWSTAECILHMYCCACPHSPTPPKVSSGMVICLAKARQTVSSCSIGVKQHKVSYSTVLVYIPKLICLACIPSFMQVQAHLVQRSPCSSGCCRRC